jgi:hypothetical protein
LIGVLLVATAASSEICGHSITSIAMVNFFADHEIAGTCTKRPLSIVFAIPDHPWVETAAGADVRIAMTVCDLGEHDGTLLTVEKENSPDTYGQVELSLSAKSGRIRDDLTVGADIHGVVELQANSKLCCPGFKLHGSGFIVPPSDATRLGLGRIPGLESHLRPYMNGRDLAARSRTTFVLDFFGLTVNEVREQFPEAFQWILERVKPERDQNPRAAYRDKWWIFGEPRADFRPALRGLRRYISTIETARRRYFVFLDAVVAPDNKLVAIASDDAFTLGVLSSSIHSVWALAAGGWLGVGNDPVYVKSKCFDPFPFPLPHPDQVAGIRALGERLDAHRKARQTAHPELTLTGVYQVLEKVRHGAEFTEKDKVVHDKGLVSLLKSIHDDLDAAVLDGYDWPRDLNDEQIIERVVKLNAERAAGERKGIVRWLRPEFQAPESAEGKKARAAKPQQQALIGEEQPAQPLDGMRPVWPRDLAGRMLAVRSVLQRGRTMTAPDVARAFIGRADKDRAQAVTEVLIALRALGQALAVTGAGEARWTSTIRG